MPTIIWGWFTGPRATLQDSLTALEKSRRICPLRPLSPIFSGHDLSAAGGQNARSPGRISDCVGGYIPATPRPTTTWALPYLTRARPKPPSTPLEPLLTSTPPTPMPTTAQDWPFMRLERYEEARGVLGICQKSLHLHGKRLSGQQRPRTRLNGCRERESGRVGEWESGRVPAEWGEVEWERGTNFG